MNEYIADILGKAGYKTFGVLDGAGALEAFRSTAPDLVILDIFMPNKDGLEVLVEIRHQRSKVPVLVISGKQLLLSDASMGLARQLGANDVLSKPFTPEELVNRVSLLRSTRVEEANMDREATETNFLTLRKCVDMLKSHFRR